MPKVKYNFFKIFIFFILGSIFGVFFEGIIHFVQHGYFMRKADVIYGPFCTLYGWGVVLFIVFLGSKKNISILKTFIYGSLLGGLFEYIMGFLAKVLLKIEFWNYSNMKLNINGLTTVPIMILWGIMGTIVVKLIEPFLDKLLKKIPFNLRKIILWSLLIFIVLNVLISYTAFFRMINRVKGKSPKTFIGNIYDKIYDNDFMYKKFPILKGKL